MTKQMKRKLTAVQEIPEPQTDIHTAVIEGDNVVDVTDFSQSLSLDVDDLELTVNGVPVERAHPQWHYAWFDERDLPIRLRQGYHIVNDSDVIATGQSTENRKKDGCIKTAELTACRVPMELFNRRLDYAESELRANEESIESMAEFAREIDGRTGGTVTHGVPAAGGISIRHGN